MRIASLSGGTRPRDKALSRPLGDIQNWLRPGMPHYTVPLIDLHSRRREERARALRKMRRDLVVGALSLLFLGATLVPLTLWLTTARDRLTRLEADATQWRQRSQNLATADAALTDRLRDWTRYQDSKDRRSALHNLCSIVSGRLPASVFLEQAQFDTRTDPERIVLIGGGESMTAVQTYARSLVGIPFFTNVRLVETMPLASLGPEGIHFRIEARGNGALIAPKE